jgi:hypothetical protein
MSRLSMKHLQELFIFARQTFNYDPDVWGDTLEEAVGRVKAGYHVPYPLVKLLVEHMTSMQIAILTMDAAVEARMDDLDDREKKLTERKKAPKTLLGKE